MDNPDLNDISMFVGKTLSGEDFCRTIIDQFDQIYKDRSHRLA
jgi:allantoinase